MGGSSAGEVFSSPEAANVVGGAAIGGGSGAAMGGGASIAGFNPSSLDPFKAGADAAREQRHQAERDLEAAKKLQTTVETAGSQTVQGTNTQTSGTTFAPASAGEQALRDASIANFEKQQALVGQAEAGIDARLGTQAQARDTLGGVLGGGAFELSAGEEARINRLREADIGVGSEAVNALLTERLGEVSADAARRGVRGQAFSQLQTGALGEAAKSLERRTLEANRVAAGQALAMPSQRVGIQAQSAGQFADFADAARQQAIANRQSLQDPVALQQMLDERLRGGTTTATQTTDQTTTSADKRVGTGEGAAGILQGMAQGTTPGAGGLATGLGAIGTLAEVAGAAGKAAGGGA